MAWDGSGQFSRTNGTQTGSTTWANARDAGNNITAAQHDTHDQDLADGINACLAKNGENGATGAIKPATDDAIDLGATTKRWRRVYISGYMGDANGNELLKFAATASAVNELTVTNAATGTPPKVSATGGDTNIGLRLEPKGSGPMSLETIGVRFQGRLTLTSGTPVTTGDVTGATTVYATPYNGDSVELYDGTDWQVYKFTELSQETSDTAKSPAAVANNSNYDIFVWNDAGTLRATRGPLWTSDTARGTGAGTTELELFEGRYVNKVAISNGPAARKGLYVGTIRSDGSAQINDSLAKRHVWNTYNRRVRPMSVYEATNSWSYNSTTVRQANASAANQLDMVRGLDEDSVSAEISVTWGNDQAANAVPYGCFVGLDSTTARAATSRATIQGNYLAGGTQQITAGYAGLPGLGRRYLAWLESASGTGTYTVYGDNNSSVERLSGISGECMA